MAITLKVAFALNGTPDLTSFKDLQDQCKNPSYFTSSKPINHLSSWEGYTSATIVDTVTRDYGAWSYNWTTNGNSTRTIEVRTYNIMSDGSEVEDTSKRYLRSETGGTRYICTSEEKYVNDAYGQVVNTFPANGSGSKTLDLYVYNYWGSVAISTSNDVTGISVSCDGFKCSVSGTKVTITANNLGTTQTSYKKSTIVSSKSGFSTRSGYASIAQEANVRSVSSCYFVPYKPNDSWIVNVSNGQWATCPITGGYVKAYGYANYTHTSGSPLNDQYVTDNAQLTWSGSPSWITAHTNGGYKIASNAKNTSTRSSNATWTYGGKTSGAKTLTQANDSITYGPPNVKLSYANTPWNPTSQISPSISVTQSRTWASGTSDSYSPSYTATWSVTSGSSYLYVDSSGKINFTSANKSISARTGTVKVNVTANGKTGSTTATPIQNGYPLSVDAYQVGYSGSTTAGGGTISVGSSAYLYAKITNTGGSAINTITWSPKNNSGYGTIGGQYSTSYSMYNNGSYSGDEITCTVKLANGVTASDVVYVSLIKGPNTGGTGGGDSSGDSSSWSLRRNSSNDNNIEDTEIIDESNNIANEQD